MSYEIPLHKRLQGCPAVVIGCIDFRFRTQLTEYVEREMGFTEFDGPIRLAGGAKGFLEPDVQPVLMRQIAISMERHKAHTVILANHEDCAGYGTSRAFSSFEVEKQKHTDDLHAARKILQTAHPELSVICLFQTFDGVERVD